MKYNIKEILDLDIDIDDKLVFINYIDDLGNKHEYEVINAEQLLDYITNLQEDYDKAMKLVDKGVENSYKKLKEQQKEITRLNNIINRMEKDLEEMYITFGEFNEEYTEKKIRELKEGK